MNVTCPECRSVFRLDPAKITSVALRARCSVCGGIIPVGASVRWTDDLATPRGSDASPSRRTPSGSTAGRTESAQARETPGGAKIRTRTPPFASRVNAAPSPPGATPPPTPVVKAPASPAPTGSTPASPSFGAPLRPPPRATIPEAPRQASTASRKSGPAPMRSGGDSAAAFSTPSTPTSQAVPTGKRPINPFLANDPNHKARRLARALVSDMVTYHPTRREEGLKSGTLKQVFREEIKKSYEEYVEQVGREFAESTTHFQDALNDVLAGGRKIF
jgi:predicted Zn finger-like uncharacterized protein